MLFGGVCGFFIGHVVTVEQTPDGAGRHLQAMGLPDIVNQLGKNERSVSEPASDNRTVT